LIDCATLERLARLGVAVQRRVVVGLDAEEHAAPDLSEGKRAHERRTVWGKTASASSEKPLPSPRVLVVPAVVREEVKAVAPREIHPVAQLQPALLRAGEGVVCLVAEVPCRAGLLR
jgi:hypothetical protein